MRCRETSTYAIPLLRHLVWLLLASAFDLSFGATLHVVHCTMLWPIDSLLPLQMHTDPAQVSGRLAYQPGNCVLHTVRRMQLLGGRDTASKLTAAFSTGLPNCRGLTDFASAHRGYKLYSVTCIWAMILCSATTLSTGLFLLHLWGDCAQPVRMQIY